MTNISQDLITAVTDFIQSSDSERQAANFTTKLVNDVKSQPFLYAYLRDLIVAIEKLNSTNFEVQINLLKTINKRLEHFHHWQSDDNETIKLIEQGIIQANEIKPHIRFPDINYKTFYEQQNKNVGQRLKKRKKTPFNRLKSHNNIVFNHYDHSIRKSHALNVIETYMAVLEKLDIEINKKWLDIGCGTGQITNAVNSKRHANAQWEIHGCDLQSNKIQVAKNKATKKRYFYQENVLVKLKHNSKAQNEFDIISMFEFCEHFADPFSLLKDISNNSFKIMVIATPLEQKLNAINDTKPDPVHLWSFSAIALIKMLERLNLKIIYDSKISVGKYTKGLDWLTIVATKQRIKKKINKLTEF